jgi:uncharacterized membrane protein HdeD (DUF308 family)
VTLFTSVTKRTFGRATLVYLSLTIFCIVFTIIYEKFSYGESSIFMRLMFLAPLAGAVVSFLSGLNLTWITKRGPFLLFNSSLAIIASACLVRGIIEVSGRTSSYDQPYWWAALAFSGLSLVIGLLSRDKKQH